ncbi:EF-hand domain-containing protein [Streptomyces purpureus]|uniref:EF-hand domain-containing protein n=1 Tax=Streptomyces purpureus TaxID=1951 RepID=UPI0037A66ED8
MTTTTSRDTRLERLFEATDVNADGYVEWADHQLIVERILDAYKTERDGQEGQTLKAAYAMAWQEVRRHAGGKERLNKAEYTAALRATVLDTSRFNLVEALPHAVFDIIDTDGDGLIDKGEYQRWLEVWDITAPDAMNVFHALDTDGDGTISRQESVRSWREFFLSDDPRAAGTLFFGTPAF